MPGWVFWVLEAVSVACVIQLWARAPGSIAKKMLWTPIALIPVIGPLFYDAIYQAPPEQDEDLQANETDTDGEDT